MNLKTFHLIFRSRPVARVEATTTFDVNSKLINLDDKACTTIRDHKKVTCATVNSCLKYNGVNLPAQIGEKIKSDSIFRPKTDD